MKYGCIGEHLKHSFSKEIHNVLADYEYEIKEIAKQNLDTFLVERKFKAINVTIPYKEAVIPHLSFIDEHAKLIGAVNTVVNKDGKLFGYNTDFYGMTELIKHAGVTIKGKKVAILGTGGTSKTAFAVTNSMGAKEVIVVSRKKSDKTIDYNDLILLHKDVEVIINTTPCGMYPNNYSMPVDIDDFCNLEGVIDAVYNPLRTQLVSKALKKGIKAEGGLYMLVAQAVKACEIFTDTTLPLDALEKTFKRILQDKENIVLVGMPASGKTTVGSIISTILDKPFIDTDVLVESKGDKISEIFAKQGEKAFRDLETNAICEAGMQTRMVIATGGGAILRQSNVDVLKQNGKLYFIDRPLKDLIPTDDRPLSTTREAIEKRYNERYDIYKSVCDYHVKVDGTAEQVAQKIIGEHTK
ncbi:MAG: shikimate dehydrogenase [Clostridia bacterium]|nr:shikimate dehydrogenase [Clostridia bacterium]